MSMQPRQLILAVPPPVYGGLERRARANGRRLADFALMLLEAAFSARVGIERQQPVVDAELDEAVRAVFCLAGEFDTRAIARVTGYSPELVDKVLRGLKQVAGEGRTAVEISPLEGEMPGKAEGVVPLDARHPLWAAAHLPLEGEITKSTAADTWAGETALNPPTRRLGLAQPASRLATPEIDWAAARWGEGISAAKIAKALNVTLGSFTKLVCEKRELFPKRFG